MSYVELACYKIKKLNMQNKIIDTQEIVGYNKDHISVEFNEDHTMAIATLVEEIGLEDDPSKFYIKLILEGVFSLEGVRTKAQKEKVHRRCYDDLFPLAEQIIRFLTIHSGMSEGISIQKRTLKQVNSDPEPEKRNEKLIDFPTDI